MQNYPEIDRVVLTLIQSTALLLPVVFLTFRFYLDDATNSTPDSEKKSSARKFILMIFTLTVSGLFATIGILDFSLKPFFAFVALCALAVFFLIYGWFFYDIVT